jgi:hypothetical protein
MSDCVKNWETTESQYVLICINQQVLRLNVPISIASVLETLTVSIAICYSQCVIKAMPHGKMLYHEMKAL